MKNCAKRILEQELRSKFLQSLGIFCFISNLCIQDLSIANVRDTIHVWLSFLNSYHNLFWGCCSENVSTFCERSLQKWFAYDNYTGIQLAAWTGSASLPRCFIMTLEAKQRKLISFWSFIFCCYLAALISFCPMKHSVNSAKEVQMP